MNILEALLTILISNPEEKGDTYGKNNNNN